MQTDINTKLGSYIALAGIIAALLQRWNIIIDQSTLATVVTALAIIYGWIHQFIITRKLKNVALSAGIMGIK